MSDTIWIERDTYLRGRDGSWRVVDFSGRTTRPATADEAAYAILEISRFERITGNEVAEDRPVVIGGSALDTWPGDQRDLFGLEPARALQYSPQRVMITETGQTGTSAQEIAGKSL